MRGCRPLHGGLCESFRVFMPGMLQKNNWNWLTMYVAKESIRANSSFLIPYLCKIPQARTPGLSTLTITPVLNLCLLWFRVLSRAYKPLVLLTPKKGGGPACKDVRVHNGCFWQSTASQLFSLTLVANNQLTFCARLTHKLNRKFVWTDDATKDSEETATAQPLYCKKERSLI